MRLCRPTVWQNMWWGGRPSTGRLGGSPHLDAGREFERADADADAQRQHQHEDEHMHLDEGAPQPARRRSVCIGSPIRPRFSQSLGFRANWAAWSPAAQFVAAILIMMLGLSPQQPKLSLSLSL
jgi:hypothetical protein